MRIVVPSLVTTSTPPTASPAARALRTARVTSRCLKKLRPRPEGGEGAIWRLLVVFSCFRASFYEHRKAIHADHKPLILLMKAIQCYTILPPACACSATVFP